jgi:hypothetical protein
MDVQVSVCVLELYNEVLRCLLSGKEVVLMMGPGGLLLDGAVEQVRGQGPAADSGLACGLLERQQPQHDTGSSSSSSSVGMSSAVSSAGWAEALCWHLF